jgi:hypothetical protein
VIDLRETPGLDDVPAPAPDPEVVARLRFEADMRAAQAELAARRRWHWSGERIVQEGRRAIEWWEDAFADPYAILDLLPGASWAEINAARRRIARECHPDALIGREHEPLADEDTRIRRMAAANDAYERLRRAVSA